MKVDQITVFWCFANFNFQHWVDLAYQFNELMYDVCFGAIQLVTPKYVIIKSIDFMAY